MCWGSSRSASTAARTSLTRSVIHSAARWTGTSTTRRMTPAATSSAAAPRMAPDQLVRSTCCSQVHFDPGHERGPGAGAEGLRDAVAAAGVDREEHLLIGGAGQDALRTAELAVDRDAADGG